MKKCIIGIPIYKANLNDTEKISLQRMSQCFKNEEIAFIAPISLKFDFTEILSEYQIRRFPDHFFNNRRSYSQLLLATTFYESFKDYEYLLICQLDVFVFSNRLNEFCDLNYDYIGAPIYFPFGAEVGNGGFSLRKITSCIRMLKMRDEVYFNNPWQLSLEMMEDQFFSYCGVKKDLNFRVPKFKLARKFALDACFEIKYKVTQDLIPFAIHNFNFVSSSWKQKISRLGFNLPKVSSKEEKDFKKKVKQMQLCFLEYKLYQSPNLSKIKVSFKKIFPGKIVTLWGYGTNGNRCQNLFKLAGIKIPCIYDNAFTYTKYEHGTLYTSFYQTGLKGDTPILISTSDYEDEISDQLTELGLKKNQDFFLFSEIEEKVLNEYFDEDRNLKRGIVLANLKIGALIVTYNPEISKLFSNIKAISPQVDRVVVVDNGSINYQNIIEVTNNFNIKIINLGKNLGIAAAQNRGMSFLRDRGFDWVMTLDQDSIVPLNTINEMKKSPKFQDPSTGMLTMQYSDPNWTEQQRRQELKPTNAPDDLRLRVISSGNLIRTKVWNLVGGFDEWMFIDQVDFDFDAKMTILGYKIWKLNKLVMQHEVGRTISNKLFLKKLLRLSPEELLFNHSPIREYYINRNLIVYSKRYQSYPKFERFKLNIYDNILLTRKILLYEKPKLKKFWFALKGILAGIRYNPDKDDSFLRFKDKIVKINK